MEIYYCAKCFEPFTEFDEGEAEWAGYSTDPTHKLCPYCYNEDGKAERLSKSRVTRSVLEAIPYTLR